MSKKLKSIISLLIVTLMFASTFLLSLPAYAAESEGITFTANDLYRPTKEFESAPNTFEAWIKMPTSLSSNRGGVILGNYNQSYRVMNFEIHSSGRPRLYLTDEKGTLFDLIFTDVNVYTGEWTHLTLVRNVAEKRVECYINGVLKQSLPVKNNSGTLDDKGLTQFIPAKGLALGGDVRGGNAQYFKGAIREVAVYSTLPSSE